MSPNRLIQEKSPYLLQHAYNPVDWYPWGVEAFAKARQEDKPIFLSIGYSTCHWCHVMERESFENPEIAQILNQHFVPIKVDREERPDIDGIYMNVVMAMTGSGGWPLSAFLTPERKPFYGGTYFPPLARWGTPGFKELLLAIHHSWIHQRAEILQSSETITLALQGRAARETSQSAPEGPADEALLQTAAHQLKANHDHRHGGFGNAPKFPMGHALSFLLRAGQRFDDAQSRQIVQTTLVKMSEGGIYDVLGGGFHRYSTDAQWQVPHFEKMLYDQALLLRPYLEAFQLTGQTRYAQIARETFEYVLRDLCGPEGAFYSAEDADSLDPDEMMDAKHSAEKKEGIFYLWSSEEIDRILDGEEAVIFKYHFGVATDGNVRYDPHGEFGHKNILYVSQSFSDTAVHFGKSEQEVQALLQSARQKLFATRSSRPRPHRDDKILMDWNGLMISALALGARMFVPPESARYAQAAQRAVDFILKKLQRDDGRLLHRYRDGESGILATLEDYAFLVQGLLDLYESTFAAGHLQEAVRLTKDMIRLFGDSKSGGFCTTGKDAEELLWRPKDIYDGAIPSGNSVALLNLGRLFHLTFDEEFAQWAQKSIAAFAQEVRQQPSVYPQWLMGLDFLLGPTAEIVVVGQRSHPSVQETLRLLALEFAPRRVTMFLPLGEDDNLQRLYEAAPWTKNCVIKGEEVTVYICEKQACQKPLIDLAEVKEWAKKHC